MKVLFSPAGWEDYLEIQSGDRTLAIRLNGLIQEVRRHPFTGIGKPEPLRNELAGFWSRRIDAEHRLVYRVRGKDDEQVVEIAQCRFHYHRR